MPVVGETGPMSTRCHVHLYIQTSVSPNKPVHVSGKAFYLAHIRPGRSRRFGSDTYLSLCLPRKDWRQDFPKWAWDPVALEPFAGCSSYLCIFPDRISGWPLSLVRLASHWRYIR